MSEKTEAEIFLEVEGLFLCHMRGAINWTDNSNFPDFISRYHIREKFIERFGFAVLTQQTVWEISKYAPLLEIGCGSGYWAFELRKTGIDIVASDPGTGRYRMGEQMGGWPNSYLEIERLKGVEAIEKYPSRNLLMVWPDMSSWPAESLRCFQDNFVLYVGEGDGGCTGDDTFHSLLESDFDQTEILDIPQFDSIHDALQIWERKAK